MILFSSTIEPVGNNSNLVDNNSITSSSDAARPANAIYSEGKNNSENTDNIISNNHLFNFFNPSLTLYGINLGSNTISWSNADNARWYWIYLQSGSCDVGSSAGNSVGSNVGAGSITVNHLATRECLRHIYRHRGDS